MKTNLMQLSTFLLLSAVVVASNLKYLWVLTQENEQIRLPRSGNKTKRGVDLRHLIPNISNIWRCLGNGESEYWVLSAFPAIHGIHREAKNKY